jgi:hypothetical protein
MSQSAAPFPIPHRAKGITLGDLAIEFRADTGKVVFSKGSIRDEHYTIQFGENSGVLDIHRTWWDECGLEHHKTLFAMLRDDIPKLLTQLSPVTMGLLSLRRLRLGWLVRHGIDIVRGLDPSTVEEIAAVTTFGGTPTVRASVADVWRSYSRIFGKPASRRSGLK